MMRENIQPQTQIQTQPSDLPVAQTDVRWGIAEFAQLFDVTPRTLRFYEDKGLLSPRRDNGTRVFGPVDHARFVKIMRGKRLGFTLDDIKDVLDVTDGHVNQRSELIKRRQNFEKVIRSLDRRRDDIDALTQDMTDICELLDAHLEKLPESVSVSDLATAYDARLRQSLVDDFSHDTRNLDTQNHKTNMSQQTA